MNKPLHHLLGATVMAFGLTVSLNLALAAEPVGPQLTPKLRGLLSQEMAEIVVAMQAIYGGIVQGDHELVANKAQAIHDSFILERSLTEEDRRSLQAAVPESFLELDRHFHEQSAALAEAADSKDSHQELIRFQQMTEACVACHARYATDRFPDLKRQQIPEAWGLNTLRE